MVLALESVAAAGLALSELLSTAHGCVRVDRRIASLWFGSPIRPLGWSVPPPWDSIARIEKGQAEKRSKILTIWHDKVKKNE